ncbi:MAG: hypothetical protein WD673_13430 [Alphaproteobacteria bacterium]
MNPTWADAEKDERKAMLRTGIAPLDYPGPVAADWPDLLAIVESKVKPARDVQKRKALRERWWHYAEKRPGLYRAIRGLDRVLVRSLTSKHFPTFSFVNRNTVYDQTLIVFVIQEYELTSCFINSLHEVWTTFFGATLEDRRRYNIADCFETFPFPRDDLSGALEDVGRAYYEHRAELMVANGEGLTDTYNRFNDPEDTSPGIVRLRELHAEMDRAVLDAYGWNDLRPEATFEREWETDEEAGPWRYRWPQEDRDEALARLLALNAERAAEEARNASTIRPGLFGDDVEDEEEELEEGERDPAA